MHHDPPSSRTVSLIRYIDDKRCGQCVWHYPSGNRFISCTYENGKKHGLFTKYFDNEKGSVKYEGRFEDGLKVGVHKLMSSPDTIELHTTYAKGLKHGTHKGWFKSVSFEIEFNMGIRHGRSRYRQSGVVYKTVEYTDGNKHGVCQCNIGAEQIIERFEHGKRVSIERYKNGERVN